MLRKFIGLLAGVLVNIGLNSLFFTEYSQEQHSLIALLFLILPSLCGGILASIIVGKYWLLNGFLVPVLTFVYLGVRFIFLTGVFPFWRPLVIWLPSGVAGGYIGRHLAQKWHKRLKKKSSTS